MIEAATRQQALDVIMRGTPLNGDSLTLAERVDYNVDPEAGNLEKVIRSVLH